MLARTFLAFFLATAPANVMADGISSACEDGRHLVDANGFTIVVDRENRPLTEAHYWINPSDFKCDKPSVIRLGPGKRGFLTVDGRILGTWRQVSPFVTDIAETSMDVSSPRWQIIDMNGTVLMDLPQASFSWTGSMELHYGNFFGPKDGPKSHPATKQDVLNTLKSPNYARYKWTLLKCPDGNDVVRNDDGVGYGDGSGRTFIAPRPDIISGTCFNSTGLASVLLKPRSTDPVPPENPPRGVLIQYLAGHRCWIDKVGTIVSWPPCHDEFGKFIID